MTRIKFAKKSNPSLTVKVFDQDAKNTYFHDHADTPDFMDNKKFNEEFVQQEQEQQ